jgi:hypothetical protein
MQQNLMGGLRYIPGLEQDDSYEYECHGTSLVSV